MENTNPTNKEAPTLDDVNKLIKKMDIPALKKLQKHLRQKVYEAPQLYTRPEYELAIVEGRLMKHGGVSLIRAVCV